MRRFPFGKVVLALAVASPLMAPAPAGAAGLFDAIGELFGLRPEPRPTYRPSIGRSYGSEGGLDITVRPRRAKPQRSRATARKQLPPAPTVTLNFDPATNATWYLDDPSLRDGDIVVIKGEVLVFKGRGPAPHAREDFTSLSRSGLSAEEREKIGAMARIRPDQDPLSDARGKTATVGTDGE